MKTMKFTLMLFLAALTITSCSSDDDGGSSISNDALIGTWQLTSRSEDGENIELDRCELQETVSFTSETLTVEESFISPFDSSECSSQSSSLPYVLEGNVISIDTPDLDDILEGLGGFIEIEGIEIDTDDLETTVENTEVTEIVSVSSTTLVVRVTENFDGETFVETSTFTKI